MDEIALIEELAANAVPAAVVQELDGWRLRFNGGVTRRANSVLAVRVGTRLDGEARLALVEHFYRRRGQVARFQLCPTSQPATLDALLAERGYRQSAPTLVQTASLATLMDQANAHVQVAEQFDERWLAAYVEGEGERDPGKIAVRRLMLQRIGPPAGFASLEVEGQLAAVALGVVERGWLGVFSVATRPVYRGRGLARTVLSELASWARGHGAEQAYLQVFSLNEPALRLYARLGFATRYEYRYREADFGDGGRA